jgi:hypothetical protein
MLRSWDRFMSDKDGISPYYRIQPTAQRIFDRAGWQ